MRGWTKKSIIWDFILIFSLISINYMQIEPIQASTVNFTLVAKTSGSVYNVDLLHLVAQKLQPLGIDLQIIYQDWPNFIEELLSFHDYDLVYLDMAVSLNPDYSDIYSENGTSNLFGYDKEMDWNVELETGKNEWYLNQAQKIFPPNSNERIQHIWDWEQYLMDKLCPLLPIFVPKTYTANWKPLKGYNSTEDLIQSWGKMFWQSTTVHEGQNRRDEIVVSDYDYSELNPILLTNSTVNSKYINSFTLDPLLWIDSDRSIWPHLGTIKYLNNTHIQIDVRQGITWANDTDDLFYNERLDAEDIYFTFYLWKSVLHDTAFDWLEDMKITGNYTLEMFIDDNPATIENEPSIDYLTALSQYILPEHYLNQTQLIDGITPDITHTSWEKFSKYCFGTGLFEINTQLDHFETTLNRRTNSWWLDTTITKDPSLNWQVRFGDFNVGGTYKNLTKLKLIVTNDIIDEHTLFMKGQLDIIDVWKDYQDNYENNQYLEVQQSGISNILSIIGYNLRQNRGAIADRAPTPTDPGLSMGLAVRKAINYAIDREEMNKILNGNNYQIINHPTNPRMGIWLNPRIIKYDHDLQLAKEIMVNAGFTIDNFTPRLNGFSLLLSSLAVLALLPISSLIKKRQIKNK